MIINLKTKKGKVLEMKHFLRSVLCIVLCIAMLLPMASCGKNDAVSSPDEECVDGECRHACPTGAIVTNKKK